MPILAPVVATRSVRSSPATASRHERDDDDRAPGSSSQRARCTSSSSPTAPGSMAADGKMQALNNAIRETIPHLVDVAGAEPARRGARRGRSRSRPAPAGTSRRRRRSTSWCGTTSTTGGYTDLGAALDLLASAAARPADGGAGAAAGGRAHLRRHADRRLRAALGRFLDEPMGRRAVRMAVGIGRDADSRCSSGSSGTDGSGPVTANNPEQLVRMIRWATTHASRVASNLVAVEPGVRPADRGRGLLARRS